MKRHELKALIKEIIKESLLPLPLSAEKSLTNDDRIIFAIDMDKTCDWVVQYEKKPIGKLYKVNDHEDKDDEKTQFRFEASDPNFKGLDGKVGSAKMLKINFIRWVDYKIKK